MLETIAAIFAAAGFVFVIRLISGPHTGEAGLEGLFSIASMPARPRGVQEMDLAPFRFPDAPPVATSTLEVRAIDERMEPARAA